MTDNDPPEREIKDFEFIQLCKFRVSTSDNADLFSKRGKLVACSSNYGLLFFGTKSGFNVVKTQELMKIDEGLGKERNKVTVNDVPVEFKVDINSSQLVILDVSGDGLYLAAVVSQAGTFSVLFYDIRIFADKNAPVFPFATMPLSVSQPGSVLDLSWNPAVYSMLAVCTSDGLVQLVDVADKPKVIATLPSQVGASCFCWSPKGKQLLVGKMDGSLGQYDHGLVEKKNWPVPNILKDAHSVLDVVWQSTHTFIAAYLPVGAQPSEQPSVILTSANKDQVLHINFYDVCFGNGEERQPHYFFHQVLKWEMVLIASSNSTEATVIGKNLDDKTSWEHWNLEDCSRAQLPLTADQNDSFPVGLAVDYSPMKQIMLSDNKCLPPCPVMYLLTTDGILLGYYLHYSHKDAAPATTPAHALSSVGARKGVPGTFTAVSPPKQPAQDTSNSALLATPLNVFGVNKPTATPAPSIFGAPAASPFGAPTPTQSIFGGRTPTSGIFGAPATTSNVYTAPTPTASIFGTPTSTLGLFGASTSTSSVFTAPTPTSSIFGKSATPASTLSTPNVFGVAAPVATSAPGSTGAGATPSLFGSAVPTATSTPAVFGSVSPATSTNVFSTTTTTSAFSFSGLGTKTTTTPNSAFTGRSFALPPSAPATVSSKGDSISVFGQQKATPQSQPVFGSLQPSSASVTPVSSMKATGVDVGQGTLKNEAAATSSLFGAHQAPSAFTMKTQQPGGSISQGQSKSPLQTTTPPAQPLTKVMIQPQKQNSTNLAVSQSTNVEAALDSSFTQNIQDEIADFEKELDELRARSKQRFDSVGTPKEKETLIQETERLIHFFKEINITTKEQLREAQEQKNCCYNLFATVENCKMQHELSNDPHHNKLLQSKKLDPAGMQKLKTLQQMSQAIEFSLEEVDHVLDAKWQEHLNNKKKEERLLTPTGDSIYKAIKNNNTLIMCNWDKLKKLEEQFMNLKMYSKASNRDIQSLKQTVLNGDNQSSSQPSPNLTSAVANGMTPEKIARLRDFLSQRKVPRVKSTTPTNISLSRIISQSPGHSPSESASPQQQQSAQRKHALKEQQQTPTGPPTSTPVAPADLFRANGASEKMRMSVPPVSPAVKVENLSPASNTTHAPSSKIPPTSFSGVAYFKPSPQTVVVTKPLLTTPQSAKSPLGLSEAARSITFSNPPGGLKEEIPQSAYYEDVTTEDDNDEEEEDYEDEDNGYEDEDEEEEDTGYDEVEKVDGASFSFGQTPTSSKTAAGGTFKPPQNTSLSSLGKPTGQPTALNDIFSPKPLIPSNESEKSSLTRSSSNGFSVTLPKPSEPSSKFVFGGGSAVTVTTTSTTTLFGQKTESKQATGFSFGGTAVFGQKLPASSGVAPTSSIFGSVATPSKNVTFSDVNVKNQEPSDKGDGSTAADSKTDVIKSTPQSTSPTSSVSVSSLGQRSEKNMSDASQFNFGATPSTGQSSSTVFGQTSQAAAKPSGDLQNSTTVTTDESTVSSSTQPSTVNTTSTLTSVFGSTSTTTAASGFGSPASSVPGITTPSAPTTATSSFGTPATSVIGASTSAPATTPVSDAAASNASSIFSGSKSSIFGLSSTPTQPLFGTPTTTASSVFGGTPTTSAASIFGGSAASAKSVFGGNTGTPETSSASVFGGSASTTSVFGGSTGSTLFGGPKVTASSSVFGGAAATTASVFGSPAASTSSSSVFGNPVTTTSSSLFGTASSAFGVASTAASSTPFGGTSASSTNLFGAATTTTSSTPFGTAATTTASAVFGGGTGTSQTSVFGNSGSVFGQTSSKPLFGGTSAAPVFGSSGTTSNNSNVFGASSGTSVFGSSSGTSALSPGTGLFGAGTHSGSTFGQTFGFGSSANSASTTSSVFGQQANLPSTSSSVFGQSSFGTSSFGFGGLGGKPSEEKAKQNVFGTPQVFGSSAQTNNLFGGGGSSTFGGTSSSPFSSSSSGGGGGGFAGGTGVASTGFGVSTQQSSGLLGPAPAFGTAPSFGSSATFGSKPAFGSSPAFGGVPAFGASPSFASPSSGTSFGSSSTGGFGNFASVQAPTFGQLAQASPSSTTTGFGGFGSSQTSQSSVFGGGFNSSQSTFGGGGGNSVFGQAASSPSFGGTPTQGFGASPSLGGNPAFSSYRG
ncbi:nuclear pore complex protein Nup214-like isoform X2 [Biomphalaria glabrata]|nr:nuclear pore complex protein Nup214-like isoform X2 [Biomphalaria glabrata]